MLTVAIPKRNKLQNIIVLTPKDGTPKDGIPFYCSPLSVKIFPFISLLLF